MIRGKTYAAVVALAIPMVTFVGCRQTARFSVPVDLSDSLGQFEVTAGEPVQNKGTITTPNSSITIGGGTLQIDPEDVSFTPADGGAGKGSTTFQSGGTFTITVGVAEVESLETVCEDPVAEYRPFTVTVNEDNDITSIVPSSVNLTESTIDLINGGTMSICITVESTIDGTVDIDQLELSVGL